MECEHKQNCIVNFCCSGLATIARFSPCSFADRSLDLLSRPKESVMSFHYSSLCHVLSSLILDMTKGNVVWLVPFRYSCVANKWILKWNILLKTLNCFYPHLKLFDPKQSVYCSKGYSEVFLVVILIRISTCVFFYNMIF